MKQFIYILILLTCSHVHAQDLAQQANNIFEHSCLGCHGPNGTLHRGTHHHVSRTDEFRDNRAG